MDETQLNHVELVVNENSEFITVDDLSAAYNTAEHRPAVGTFALTLGNDGITGMTDADCRCAPGSSSLRRWRTSLTMRNRNWRSNGDDE